MPYDITDLRPFAYSPGLVEWLAILAVVIGAFAGIWFFTRRRTPARTPLEISQSDLQDIITKERGSTLSKEALFEVSAVLRRFLTFELGVPFDGKGAVEIRRAAAEARGNDARSLLQRLAEIDEQKFMPGGETTIRRSDIMDLLGPMERIARTEAAR